MRVLVALERRSGVGVGPFLAATVRALRLYAQRYGGYPWTTYKLAVMSDPDQLFGVAYPTLGFVGDSSLVLVPHETAHQWFYSLVGNDQARDAWLSEGLTTWAQTGPEGSLGTLVQTPIPSGLRNRIGEPMSFWDRFSFEQLRLGVYVQSVQALASLGDPETIDCCPAALRREERLPHGYSPRPARRPRAVLSRRRADADRLGRPVQAVDSNGTYA